MSALLHAPQSPRDIVTARRTAMIRGLFGDTLAKILSAPGVTDVVMNSDGKIWVSAAGSPKRHAASMTGHDAEKLIYAVAKNVGEHVGPDAPSLAAEVEIDGLDLRFQGFLQPVVASACFILRVPTSRVITRGEYLRQGIITQAQLGRLEAAILARENILICGGTGSGKTTFMNALLDGVADLTPHHRVVAIERTRELQCHVADAAFLRVSDTYTSQRALQDVLRAFPDRIMVGEVRGAEALEMMMAWNTGHDGGFCTIHAKTSKPSPRAALLRLEQAASLAATTTPLRLQPMIGEVVDLVVCIAKNDAHPAGRIVSFIGAVNGWNGTDYNIEKDA